MFKLNSFKKATILSIACLSLSIPISAQEINSSKASNPLKEAVEAAQDSSSSSPEVKSVVIKENGSNPIIEITGKGFGKDGRNVMVLVNDSGLFANVLSVKNKKVVAQIPNSLLCNGTVSVRVLVNKVASNPAVFSYSKDKPALYEVSPGHAQVGTVLQLKADNLACNPQDNLVTFNGIPLQLIGVTSDSLQVRVPTNLASANGSIKLTIAGQASSEKPFTIDKVESMPPSPTSDNTLRFNNSTGVGGSLGFSPMFNIKETISNFPGNPKANLWNLNFYGTHQAIIDVPFKADGVTQKALLTINCREASNIYGNFTGEKERFIYALISFPRNPEKPYHPDLNPFFWGACAIATESRPNGEIVFNSLARSRGGIDSFEISKDATTSSKATMTMTFVAPDLGYYEDYGINYSKAGNGQVRLPKVINLTVEMQDIQPNLPTSYFRVGRVTFTDNFGNQPMVTEKATFANTFSITDVPDFGLGIFR